VGDLTGTVATAVGVFVGTNVDDFAMLLLFILGLPADRLRWPQVVAGQYLGFAVLLLVSLVGAVSTRTIGESWIGLLGLVPIALGVRGLVRACRQRDDDQDSAVVAGGVLTVTIATVANGGDNIAVYILLFRQFDAGHVVLAIGVFLVLLAAWCGGALLVGRHARRLVPGIVRGGRWVTPVVFLAIGVLVLVRTGALGQVARLL
jgi:cadmium resistance protein CadD (predicted permease)